MYLHAACDNTAATALAAFLEGVQNWGIPERVRTGKYFTFSELCETISALKT